jgi:hypothetical protein
MLSFLDQIIFRSRDCNALEAAMLETTTLAKLFTFFHGLTLAEKIGVAALVLAGAFAIWTCAWKWAYASGRRYEVILGLVPITTGQLDNCRVDKIVDRRTKKLSVRRICRTA